MYLSRRGFIGAVTGLTAIISNSAYACEPDKNGYNHLLPQYGPEHFEPSRSAKIGKFGNVPIHRKFFRIPDGRAIQEVYVGTDRYAVSVSASASSPSFTLYDDVGDGTFRKKCAPMEKFGIPNWILLKYLPKLKT